MSIYGDRSESRTATYTLTVGVAVAIVILLLSLPALNLIWRIASILALVVLQALNLAVLSHAPKRYREWRTMRRHLRALNRTSGLVPDLARLASSTQEVIYGDQQSNLHNLVRLIGQKAGAETRNELESKAVELAQHYGVFYDLAEHQTRWEETPFINFVRALGKHFHHLDPVLDACYDIAKTAALDDQTIKLWEAFKEKYNQLRARWEAYFDRVPAAIGLHVQLAGEPAMSLPQPALVGKKG